MRWLWEQLDNMYWILDTQMSINIERELESVTVEKISTGSINSKTLEQISFYHEAHNKSFSRKKKKVSKLRCSLSKHFTSIAMVAKASNFSFWEDYRLYEKEYFSEKVAEHSKHVQHIATTASTMVFKPLHWSIKNFLAKSTLCVGSSNTLPISAVLESS